MASGCGAWSLAGKRISFPSDCDLGCWTFDCHLTDYFCGDLEQRDAILRETC
jgi:hypothetical protein